MIARRKPIKQGADRGTYFREAREALSWRRRADSVVQRSYNGRNKGRKSRKRGTG
jgi:hypothetical protein